MSGATDPTEGGDATTDDLPSYAGVGGALADDASTEDPATQDEAALDQNHASNDERISGIVAQTRSDVGDQDVERITEVLTQRFAETGVDIDGDRTKALAAEIARR
jgi:hypothetical protein